MSVRFLRRKYIFHPLKKKKKKKLGTTEFDQEQSPGRRSRGIRLTVLSKRWLFVEMTFLKRLISEYN